jgi:hypothetical protein
VQFLFAINASEAIRLVNLLSVFFAPAGQLARILFINSKTKPISASTEAKCLVTLIADVLASQKSMPVTFTANVLSAK